MDNLPQEYTVEEMRSLIAQYVAHRADGFSKESFVPCDYRTIERHLEVYSDLLQSEKKMLQQADREGLLFWERLGKEIAKTGDGNVTSWIFNMKNRYPQYWADKREMKVEGQVSNITIVPDDGCEPISD